MWILLTVAALALIVVIIGALSARDLVTGTQGDEQPDTEAAPESTEAPEEPAGEEPAEEEPTEPEAPEAPAESGEGVAACDLLPVAEIEEATGISVEAEQLGGGACHYSASGSGDAGTFVVELAVVRYPGGISAEDYRVFADTQFGILETIWPDVTRQPLPELGETAEGAQSSRGAVVLANVDGSTVHLVYEVDLDGSDQDPEAKLDTAARLAGGVIERLR